MDIDKVRKALNIALREHNDLMIKADLPIGSKVIKEALDELDRDNWVSVNERLPENCNGVFVFGVNEFGKNRTAKAMYARKFELEASDDAIESGFFEYDETRDESYVPEGWYEDNSCAETNYVIDFTVTHWQPLPLSPKDAS